MNPRDFDIGVLKPILTYSEPLSWVAITLCLILISLARLSNFNYISGLFKLSTNYNQKLSSIRTRPSYLLLCNYVLISSVYLNMILGFDPDTNFNTFLPSILTIFLIFIILQILKVGSMLLLANWFGRKVYFDVSNLLRYYQIIGVIMVPLIVLSFFQNDQIRYWFIIMALIPGLLIYLYFMYKSLKTAIQFNISFFYIILYLCTLEILPPVLLVRYLVD